MIDTIGKAAGNKKPHASIDGGLELCLLFEERNSKAAPESHELSAWFCFLMWVWWHP
jgi:hypothetical protein